MATSTGKYDYINEESINPNLICTICMEPFQSPIITACDHIFCVLCIQSWIVNNSSCPVCRHSLTRNNCFNTKISPKLLSELDCLLVQCQKCDKVGIERVNFDKHYERCSKTYTMALSSFVRNPWRLIKNKRSRRRGPSTTNQIENSRNNNYFPQYMSTIASNPIETIQSQPSSPTPARVQGAKLVSSIIEAIIVPLVAALMRALALIFVLSLFLIIAIIYVLIYWGIPYRILAVLTILLLAFMLKKNESINRS